MPRKNKALKQAMPPRSRAKADAPAAMRRTAASSAFVQRLRLISSDVTPFRFPRGDDADDFFAMFILPVHMRHYQQDSNFPSGLRFAERVFLADSAGSSSSHS